jgi:hypothetical protein
MEKYLKRLPIPVYIHSSISKQDFVPEHLSPGAKRELRRPRADITFADFLNDLQEVADRWELPQRSETNGDEPEPLPLIQLASEMIPGEEFASFWYDLRQHGSLRASEFPPTLAANAKLVIQALLSLGYIAPIRYAGESTLGVKFAPSANQLTAEFEAQSILEELD